MIINTKTILTDLKGKPLTDPETKEPVVLGDVIGNILLTAKAGGKLKCFVLAQKLATQDTVDVDESDLALIKEATKETQVYNNLVAGQALVILERTGEDNKPEKTGDGA